jgi:hypothetical protein
LALSPWLFLLQIMELFDSISPDFSRAFRVAPVRGRIFLSCGCLAVLQRLSDALASKIPSVLLLTGSPGGGKTTVVNAFAELYERDPAVKLVVSSGSGLGCAESDCIESLADSLSGIQDRRVRRRMLIVDDAEALSEEQKKAVFGVAEADGSGVRGVSVVLVGNGIFPSIKGGQDSGSPRLKRYEIPLAPLQGDEVERYIRHRLVAAKCLGPDDQVPFDIEALELLFDLSQGVPQFVDHFAERALYEASREGRSVVSGDLVRASLLDSSTLEIGWPPAAVAVSRHPPAPAAPGRTLSADEHLLKGQAAPEPLRADPAMAILRPPRRGRRGPGLMLSFILMAAGAAVFLVRMPPNSVTSIESATPIAEEAGLLPDIARDAAPLPIEVAKVTLTPGLGAPSRVGADPDAAKLLEEGLQAGIDSPADAALAYERAALWGNGLAAYFIGQLFETGLGVPFDLPRAQAWYSVAAGVPGAEARLAELNDMPAADDETTATPLPLQHVLFRSGRAVLHWRNMPGKSPQRYVVEYVLANDGNQIRQAQTTLSAMLIEQPVIRWRVVSLDDQGRQAGASGWSRLVPPPR